MGVGFQQRIFLATLQNAAPPAKDFGLSPAAMEAPTRRPELAGAGYQDPSRQEGALLGNIQVTNGDLHQLSYI
jgi:hypothetical protein